MSQLGLPRRDEDYRYEPLSAQRGEIRLLYARPEREGRVVFELKHFPLVSDLRYTALSYRWGDASELQDLTVNGKSIKVPERLWSFFEPFADAVSKQQQLPLIWIDAVCIDQSNVEERNRQVLRIKDIYERADSIIIWLGPEHKMTRDAMQMLKSLAARADDSAPSWTILADPADGNISQGQLSEVSRILKNPYWSRAWCLQEASTPHISEKIFVWCGQQMITLKTLARANSHILKGLKVKELDRQKAFDLHGSRLGYVVNWRKQRSYPALEGPLRLVDVLPRMRRCRSIDPRDKLYAVISMVVDSNDLDLQPDYALSVADVYTGLVCAVLKRDLSLDMLGSCNLDERVLLPSWVPNWNTPGHENVFLKHYYDKVKGYIRLYNADLGREAQYEVLDGQKVLRVRGVVFDAVSEVTSCRTATNPEPDREVLQEWITKVSRADPEYIVKPISTIRAFQHTICADVSSSHQTAARRGIAATLLDPSNEMPDTRDVFSTLRIHDITCARRLIFTSKGYIGLASRHTQPGDKMCILFGGQMPFVLRPVENHYILVAECYVHGIMEGEALQGIDVDAGSTMFEIR